MTATRRQREERWARCREYLLRAGSIPAAIALAKRDRFSQNTSVWVTALGHLLGGRTK